MKLIMTFLILSMPIFAAPSKEPSFSLTFNALETSAFFVGNLLADFKKKVIAIPLHFDLNFKQSDFRSLSLGLVYRYESYNEQGSLYSNDNNIRPTKVWTHFNELFLLAGYRFSPERSGLSGYYFSTRAGLGVAISPVYYNFSVLAQPELGYSISFKNPGFYMNFGLGVLLNLPFIESHNFAVPWKAPKHYGLLQVLVHELIPILNIGLGFSC
jgi:hypothetical protein